ncbi:Vms1/Ankzf1 family peptidyl-tRNA hydrolase [Georgenia faecalis]|uniref:baeRF2 domain-containing protein n=1 Tax=Georgenia faecalis TaxID=2483799 RepID=UPI000FDAB1FA|nr:Vms1/Ankzf1 family peptidyl-tRNA hydrolase [Georgenia faecalis]
MQIDWLTSLLPPDEDVVTVVLDATRESESGRQAVQTRWRDLRRTLEAQGAPADALTAIDERVERPTHVSGEHGRVLVASRAGLLVDRTLAGPPASDEAVVCRGGAGAFALARVADETVRYLVAEIDRAGADVTFYDNAAYDPGHDEGTQTVEGGHDVLNKVRAPGTATRRIQARAEDSWDRNAEAVAAELDRSVARRRPELLILTGDVRAVPLVRDNLGGAARPLAVTIEGGSRADGVNQEAFGEKVRAALTAYRMRRREEVIDRFRQDHGRDAGATTGLESVVDVLRRGQVAELLVTEAVAGPPSSLAGRTLWVGEYGMQLAMSRQEALDLGVDEPRELRADHALGLAAVEQGAGVTFADEASLDLVDGVGAILRWHDASTPSDHALTMDGDTARM